MEAVKETLTRYGTPEIVNMKHGRAIGPSGDATSGHPVHLDGVHQDPGHPRNQDQYGWQGRVARRCLRRPLVGDHQTREVYLRAYASVSEARAGIGRYLTSYNTRRPHSSLDGKTSDQAYFNPPKPEAVAA